MVRVCKICGLDSSFKQKTLVHFYPIPEDDNERKSWIEASGKNIPPRGFVCSNHFPAEYLGLRKRMGALPTKVFAALTNPMIPSSSQYPDATETQEMFQDTSFLIPTPGPSSKCSDSRRAQAPVSDYSANSRLFLTIKQNENLALPTDWNRHTSVNYIIFSKILVQGNGCPFIEKSVVLSINTIRTATSNKSINIEQYVKTVDDLLNFLNHIDNKQICVGGSKLCSIFVSNKLNLCRSCTKHKSFFKKKNDTKFKIAIQKRNRQHYIVKRISHLQNVVNNLKKKCKKRGQRYSLDWIYSCILMKIKSPKLYHHMRENDILPLPSPSTISRYIRNIDGRFGFRKEVFSLIKEKTQFFCENEKHGCLLIDECKIKSTKKFDKNTMELIGFVDLGKYTPEKYADTLGDHALVLMFQPFAGHGLQALACFLSAGNVTGEIQAKIILECIILCENAGLYVDVVVSDGATWNRSMWKHLGIVYHEPWCEHPMDRTRKLRMCSDFPHLIKCLRNNLEKKKEFHVPEGLVKYSYFEHLLEFESSKEFKIAFKLTKSHIHPKHGEKMSTRLAYQLFSNTTALAMEIYAKRFAEFSNVDITVAFCKRINKLIDTMNSSSPANGLKLDSQEYQDLDSFLVYLDLWKQCSPSPLFLSNSTFEGLVATITCTKDLIKYLTGLGYKYLMTSRINQDHLEHFFGMMRAAGGCNSHPESIQVGQIFRLMSLYSLIKPPRGSNVTGGEMMKSLLVVGDLKNKKTKLIFDIIIEENVATELEEEFSKVEDAFAYFCGYVAKKMKTFKCSDCTNTIVGKGNEEFNELIREKSRGFLTFPSKQLISFLHEVEKTVTNIFYSDLKRNCLSEILIALKNFAPTILLGCQEHKFVFTKETLRVYLVSRLSICCAKEQKKRKIGDKSKHLSKMAKYY